MIFGLHAWRLWLVLGLLVPLVFGSTHPGGPDTIALAATSKVVSSRIDDGPESELMAPPPDVGDVILADSLTGPTLIPAGSCATQRGRRQYLGEGLATIVTGRCVATSTVAVLNTPVTGVELHNGSVSVAFKLTYGAERARIRLITRLDSSGAHYAAQLTPATNTLTLHKFIVNPVAREVSLANEDVTGIASISDWNTLELRLQNERIWVMLNDRVIIARMDGDIPKGGILFSTLRLGSLDDAEETTAIYRDLRVARLADEGESSGTSFTPPSPPAATPRVPAARRAGESRILPQDLTDQKACWDLGVHDAAVDRAAGLWSENRSVRFFPIDRQQHICADQWGMGYGGQPFTPQP